jgi:hypothetical protein
MEIKVKNFETLLHSGMRVRDVTAFLGLSYREVKAIQRRRKIRDRKITQRKKPLQTAI